MHDFIIVGDWLLVIALIGFIGVVIWLVAAVLALKNGVMRDAKRLYERPLRSVKNLAATGKGIVQQEGVRVKYIGATGKVAVDAVRETAVEVKTAAQSIHFSELQPLLSSARNLIKLLGFAAQVSQTAAHQGAAPETP